MPPPGVASEAPDNRSLPPRVVRTIRDAVYRATVIDAGLTARDLLAVAVSGGPDSMVLLDALHAAAERGGPALHVLHFDHAWHEGSAAVALDVADACRERNIPITRERSAQSAHKPGESLEMNARRLRHDFLRRAAASLGALRVATAHQADDQVETIVMNLARGGGPVALRGMRQDDGLTLRPLLTVWRHQVEAYAAARQLPTHRDPANQADAFRRNRIRHELLPLLDDIYPGARKALLRAGTLATPNDLPAVRSAAGVRMPLDSDRRAVAAGPLREVLNAALRADERPGPQVGSSVWRALESALADNTAGRWVQLPGGRWAYVRDRAIALYDRRVSDPPLSAPVLLEIPADVALPVGRLRVRRAARTHAACPSPTRQLIGVPPPGTVLAVRSPQPADRMVLPIDSRPHDLARLLRRRRVPAALRQGIPILTFDDQPVSVPGIAIDARYRLTDEASEALIVEVQWARVPSAAAAGGFVTEPRERPSTLDASETCGSGATGSLI